MIPSVDEFIDVFNPRPNGVEWLRFHGSLEQVARHANDKNWEWFRSHVRTKRWRDVMWELRQYRFAHARQTQLLIQRYGTATPESIRDYWIGL